MADLTENYQLKWHSFGSHLHSCVAAAHNSETFADVCLFTLDCRQILAHRFVLSACSQYFHHILKAQSKITSTLPLLIALPPEINYKTMKTLIQYMYSGETTVSKDILENVLRGGDILKVKGLWRPKEDEYHEKRLVKVHESKESTTPKPDKVEQKTDNESKPNKQDKAKLAQKPEKNSTAKPSKSPDDGAEDGKQSPKHNLEEPSSEDSMQYLVIKEEPVEWCEINEEDMEIMKESDVFPNEMTIKPEIIIEDQEESPENLYSPLTCELCAETFNLPADWVRHIQTHTDMLPAKRQRRGRASTDEDSSTFPPLHCDLCQKYFPTPAEWVRHIQNTHTEFELRLSNHSSPVRPVRVNRQMNYAHKTCLVCNKKFPSYASMLIHKRTHTGEKPYMCEYCQKVFNVKSNLLRHLRTLHDKIISPNDIDSKENHSKGDAQ